jgi:16S rRNA processing protein RimM
VFPALAATQDEDGDVTSAEDTIDVLVGVIGRPHGIQGEVSVNVRTDDPERRFAIGSVLQTRRGPLTVRSTRWHQARLLVRFDEVPDRTAAEPLRGLELRVDVPLGDRPDDPEEFYDHHLVGLRAESPSGDPFGDVVDVLHLPMQDVLVVRREGRDRLVPFVSEIVLDVDLDSGRVVVDEIPGLLDDPEG